MAANVGPMIVSIYNQGSGSGQLAHYLEDPSTPFADRDPVTDHVTVSGNSGPVTEPGRMDREVVDAE